MFREIECDTSAWCAYCTRYGRESACWHHGYPFAAAETDDLLHLFMCTGSHYSIGRIRYKTETQVKKLSVKLAT